MPTFVGHSLVAATAAGLLKNSSLGRIMPLPAWLLLLLSLSLLPDLDVLALRWLPYSHPFSHRGFWHSLPFALMATLGLSVVLFCFGLWCGGWTGFLKLWGGLAVVMASHGLLDALTDGGLGVALWSPLSHERLFFPWRPIPVAWLSPSRMFSPYMLKVYAVELALFGPFCLAAWLLGASAAGGMVTRIGLWFAMAFFVLIGLIAWALRC